MKTKIALLAFFILAMWNYISMAQQGGMNEKSGTPTYPTELHVLQTNANTVALIVDAKSNQVSDLTNFRVNGVTIFEVGSNDNIDLEILPLTAGTTGLIVIGAASQNADLAQYQLNNGTVVGEVGPNGHVALRKYTKTQIDTLVPDHGVGDMIIDTNGTLANQVCISTGTLAAQWRALQGPAALGCGTNN